MELGVCHIPHHPTSAARLARVAEEAGIGWFGVCDSPRLYGAMYPSIQLALETTTRIRVGTLVTNPVTQHWSVHAATFRAFDEMHPGRSFLGIAAGDSAVLSVGLRPGAPDEVARTVDAVREAVGDRVPIITAVGGRRAASAVSPRSDGVLLGTGLEPAAFTELAVAAGAGPGSGRMRWTFLTSHLVEERAQVPQAREAARSPLLAFTRQAIAARMEEKHVPAGLIAGLRRMFAEYVYAQHAKLGSQGAANAGLLVGDSAEVEYVFARFGMVDTVQAAASRIGDFGAAVGDFGLFLGTTVPDPETHVRLAGRLVALLAERTGRSA